MIIGKCNNTIKEKYFRNKFFTNKICCKMLITYICLIKYLSVCFILSNKYYQKNEQKLAQLPFSHYVINHLGKFTTICNK